MARSDIYTWLPIDEWGRIMGYNLWEMNGFSQWSSDQRSCGSTWYQSPNETDRVSRDEVAQAIKTAETLICDYVNYYLLPTWDTIEVNPPRFRTPGYKSNVNVRNYPKSVQMPKGHVYALGTKGSTAISTGVAITRVDLDGDSFNETARITVDLTGVDSNEVRVYYPGENGADAWEIRPIKISGNTIEWPIYLIPARALVNPLAPVPINPSDDSNYLTTVDVYRVYNDTSDRVTLVYFEDPACTPTCNYNVSSNCGYVQNQELGYVVYNPSLYTEPDQLWINYYSGYRANRTRSLVELDNYWAVAIAYLAAGLLDKPLYPCVGSQEPQLATHWQDRLDERTASRGWLATAFMAENPFGILTRGSWFAYQRAVARRL